MTVDEAVETVKDTFGSASEVPTSETRPAAAVTVAAGELGRALGNAVMFAADGKNPRPALEVVRVEVGADDRDTLTVEATDSYALYRENIDADRGPNPGKVKSRPKFVFLLGRADAIALGKACKDHAKVYRYNAAPIAVRYLMDSPGSPLLEVVTPSATFTYRDNATEWPNVDRIRDDWSQGQVATIGIGAKVLARVAKVSPGYDVRETTTGAVLRFELNSELKPFRVLIGARIDVLCMPVRTS